MYRRILNRNNLYRRITYREILRIRICPRNAVIRVKTINMRLPGGVCPVLTQFEASSQDGQQPWPGGGGGADLVYNRKRL